MTATACLRAASYLLAGIALLDPGCTITQMAPISVEVRGGIGSGSADARVSDVRDRLKHALADRIVFDSPSEPAALVLAGGRIDAGSISGRIPVSVLRDRNDALPGVTVISVTAPPTLRPGWSADVVALLQARGMAGKTTPIALEENGLELASVQQKWKAADETVEVMLPYLPTSPGTRTLRVVAGDRHNGPANGGRYDLAVTVTDQRLEVLVHEPRPSWASAFVRRALEADPGFAISTLARVSKAVEVRGGEPPTALSADAIARFDAVVVGAPEALQSREVDALDLFARRRGGAVVVVADRRPSGDYMRLLRVREFDDTLFQSPSTISIPNGPPTRGSEFAVPAQVPDGVDILATIAHRNANRPVIMSWPVGDGRIVFSGALDAWRYRGTDDGFGRFWRATVAAGAADAPAPLELALDRSVVAPGDPVVLRARIRRTEFDEQQPVTRLPAIAARAIGANGHDQSVRMWPAAGLGTFEGRFDAPSPGRYDLRVVAGRATGDVVLTVSESARAPGAPADAVASLASATGGVVVTADDLGPLVTHLEGLRQTPLSRSVHPARAAPWTVGFAMLLSAEWIVRRRRGLR